MKLSATTAFALIVGLLLLRNKFIIFLLWLNASAITQHFHWHHLAIGLVIAASAIIFACLWLIGWLTYSLIEYLKI